MDNAPDSGRTFLLCSCMGSQKLDRRKLEAEAAAAGDTIRYADHLCGAEMEMFEEALAVPSGEGKLCVACRQQQPLFAQLHEEADEPPPPINFFDLRDSAGWSDQGKAAGPKMAALLAASRIPSPSWRALQLPSQGRCLVYGRDGFALTLAGQLAGHLGVSCLLAPDADLEAILPPMQSAFPLMRGQIREIQGWFGSFSLTLDGFAEADPSARDELSFVAPMDGVHSDCDLIIDVSGGQALFPAPEKRPGYVRIPPGDASAALEQILALLDQDETLEKPIHVAWQQELCAHSRNRISGCTRCLDLCPAHAIVPAGDHVQIHPALCGGCGLCHAACPTGAARLEVPADIDFLAHARIMLDAYAGAGGEGAELLVHDPQWGTDMISALARYHRGLPARLIPFPVQAPGRINHADLLLFLAMGAQRVWILIEPRLRGELAEGLETQCNLAAHMLAGIGLEAPQPRFRMVATDEIDELDRWFREAAPPGLPRAPLAPTGSRRTQARLALDRLCELAGKPVPPPFALPEGSPWGSLAFDAERCTLCLSCVGACPTGALQDDPERPRLLFVEDACIQCGLCRQTCPETAIVRLNPQMNLAPEALSARLLLEDTPFACVRCGKEFGTTRSIASVRKKLEGNHWMFSDKSQANLIEMCADCRINAQFELQSSPFAAPARPLPRTTMDELEEQGKAEPKSQARPQPTSKDPRDPET